MQNYIGCKQIQAELMTLGQYNEHRGWTIPADEDPDRVGYLVVYPDGYQSWSPYEAFTEAYMPQPGDPNRIDAGMVHDLIALSQMEVRTLGRKTTVVTATLPGGFEITESSSCVDPANYDEALGEKLCRKRIEDRLWALLGFTLAWARNGVRAR